jgi:hypothetical protein
MSIDPISTDFTHAFSQSVRDAREADAQKPAAAAAAQDSVTVDTIPSSPPQEVFAAMLTAAQSADRLAASGKALHFSSDAAAGLSVHLTTLDGALLGTVSPTTVLHVASGGTVD